MDFRDHFSAQAANDAKFRPQYRSNHNLAVNYPRWT